MKTKIFLFCLISGCFLLSCTKEPVIDSLQNSTAIDSQEMALIEFPSVIALQEAIDNLSNGPDDCVTKTVLPTSGFVSYAETVMCEDGYDERPNAIMSEAFASVLNPEGEVIFGDYALKLFDYGILYSHKDDLVSLRRLSKDALLFDKLHLTSDFLFPIEDNLGKVYVIEDESNIYYYDMFDIVNNGNVFTKSTNRYEDVGCDTIDGVVYHSYRGYPPLLIETYTIPKGNKEQRNPFLRDSGAANDTKIYNENYLVTTQRGVKTKTVSKKALAWVKFKGNITAGVLNLCIWEPGLYNGDYYGWLDVNETVYNGQTYVIATQVITGIANIGLSNSALTNECNSALKWAKENGINIDHVDGIRYISRKDPANVFVRVKDDVRTVYDDVLTVETKLKPQGNFYTKQSSLKRYTINNAQYRIYSICWFGYSQYYEEHRGTRMFYIGNL